MPSLWDALSHIWLMDGNISTPPQCRGHPTQNKHILFHNLKKIWKSELEVVSIFISSELTPSLDNIVKPPVYSLITDP